MTRRKHTNRFHERADGWLEEARFAGCGVLSDEVEFAARGEFGNGLELCQIGLFYTAHDRPHFVMPSYVGVLETTVIQIL